MTNLLEDLWYSYQSENTDDTKNEKTHLSLAAISSEEKLRSQMTDEQKETLTNYEECLNELGGITEKEASFKGVRFATRFLFEALSEK